MQAEDSRDNAMPRPANIVIYTYDCGGENVTITPSMPY